MSVTILIPARYASTRLPGKPLLAETGKPMIQHVVEAVSGTAGVDAVVVATDDQRIFDAVEAFGGKAVMTREDHTSGSDRLAEAAEKLSLADDDIVVNVQGDEPDIPPALIETLVGLLENSDAPMATLCTPLETSAADDPNKVKVVFGSNAKALYFSRSKIPYDRDKTGRCDYYLHLGIYAYRVAFLKQFTQLPPARLEQIEKLEQLRAIENGYDIMVTPVDYSGVGIDTPEDYAQFVARCSGKGCN